MKVKYPTRQHIDALQSFNTSLNVLNIDMNTSLYIDSPSVARGLRYLSTQESGEIS